MKFKNIIEVNQYLERWCLEISDIRKLTDPMITGPATPKERWDLEQLQIRKNTRPPIAQIRHEERIIDINGLLRFDNDCYRVPDELAGKRGEIIAGRESITVIHGSRINLDKARDKISPIQQDKSNISNSSEIFEKRLEELRQDSNWRQMQEPALQRSPADYNELFGIKKTAPCL